MPFANCSTPRSSRPPCRPMADAPPTLRAQQFALSRHLRDPGSVPPPGGIEERRLEIYRELLYNNLQGLLAGNFPVIRRILDEAAWHALVRGFHAQHRSHTPLFTEIGREFVRWLEGRAGEDPALPPWLPELAHYEWVELALQVSDSVPRADLRCVEAPGSDPVRLRLGGVPVASPLACARAYRWPAHRLGPGCLPAAVPEAPTLLLVPRDATGEVRFAQLSPLAFRLL